MPPWESLYQLYLCLARCSIPASGAPLGVTQPVMSCFGSRHQSCLSVPLGNRSTGYILVCSRHQSCLSCPLGNALRVTSWFGSLSLILPLVSLCESLYRLNPGLAQGNSPTSRAPFGVAPPVISWFGSRPQFYSRAPLGSRSTGYILLWFKAPVLPLVSYWKSLYWFYPDLTQGTSSASRAPPMESLYGLYPGFAKGTSPASRALLGVAILVISWFGSRHQSASRAPLGFALQVISWFASSSPVLPLVPPWESLYQLYPGLVLRHLSCLSCPLGSRFTGYILVWFFVTCPAFHAPLGVALPVIFWFGSSSPVLPFMPPWESLYRLYSGLVLHHQS